MHPHRSWLIFAALLACVVQAAAVYKWTDSDGVVHYSDQPVPGAEKVLTETGSTAGAPASSTAGKAVSSSRPASKSDNKKTVDKTALPGLIYSRMSITSPHADQVFFGDDVVNVDLTLEPALKPDQTITWHLNGGSMGDEGPTATHLTLPHLERGAYTIDATITDQKTGESVNTDSVNFFIREPSALAPLRPKP